MNISRIDTEIPRAKSRRGAKHRKRRNNSNWWITGNLQVDVN